MGWWHQPTTIAHTVTVLASVLGIVGHSAEVPFSRLQFSYTFEP